MESVTRSEAWKGPAVFCGRRILLIGDKEPSRHRNCGAVLELYPSSSWHPFVLLGAIRLRSFLSLSASLRKGGQVNLQPPRSADFPCRYPRTGVVQARISEMCRIFWDRKCHAATPPPLGGGLRAAAIASEWSGKQPPVGANEF